MWSSCISATRSYSWRPMVLPSVIWGSSVTMNVEPDEREVTRVWTLTLSNSVIRQVGISSVKARNASGDGLSWIAFARMWSLLLGMWKGRDSSRTLPADGRTSAARAGRLPALLHREVQTNLGSILDDVTVA